ncbi:hypothetical protein [Burkholderia alba]|uniref:hypothetical protein n=1 Tax=Burkholderia alba TaxID=2683677 RepID=UPI002B059F20|nr:hypothetical protein [Burkholderia alba]
MFGKWIRRIKKQLLEGKIPPKLARDMARTIRAAIRSKEVGLTAEARQALEIEWKDLEEAIDQRESPDAGNARRKAAAGPGAKRAAKPAQPAARKVSKRVSLDKTAKPGKTATEGAAKKASPKIKK